MLDGEEADVEPGEVIDAKLANWKPILAQFRENISRKAKFGSVNI